MEGERRVVFGPDGYDEVEGRWSLPEVTEAQREEAREAIKPLQAYLAPPARAEVVGRVMAALSHHYVPGISSSVHQAVANDWAEDLSEFPMWAIEGAFRRHRRQEDRKPTIAAIREKCMWLVKKERTQLERLRKIVEAGEAR